MRNLNTRAVNWSLLLGVFVLFRAGAQAGESVLSGHRPPGFAQTFGLEGGDCDYAAQETACSAPANVLWPGEKAAFTFQFTSKSKSAFSADGNVEVINYGSRTAPNDFFAVEYYRIAAVSSAPIHIEFPSGGFADQAVVLDIPERFGAYGIVIDLGKHGRAFGAACVRTPRAAQGSTQFPTYALDAQYRSEEELALFNRLGIKGLRAELTFVPKASKDYQKNMDRIAADMARIKAHNLTVMGTVTNMGGPQPLGHPRPFLDADGKMLKTKTDLCALPESDEEFQQWCKTIAATYGWPKGPLNAMELWNEPWEGMSISGWGADVIRYRDLYTRMAQGVEEARKEGVEVLIGGACSSMNTDDKLFCDGTDTFLKWLDFSSLHYQPMGAVPCLLPELMNRKSPHGPVRVWDTESWIANSEDRVAAAIASMRAEGLSRTAGVYHDSVRNIKSIRYKGVHGKIESATIIQAWAPAAAVAAVQQFIGQRPFKELLFQDGLPWVFEFDSADAVNPDDGTLVIVGDLAGVCERDRLLHRLVRGLTAVERAPEVEKAKSQVAQLSVRAAAAQKNIEALKSKLNKAESATSDLKDELKGEQDALKGMQEQIADLQKAICAGEALDGAALAFPDNGEFTMFDFYGNPLPSDNGQINVPLNALGYFLRTNGSHGSFERLIKTVKNATISGYSPLDIAVHDFIAPIEFKPELRITVTNVLNRSVSGKANVSLDQLQLEPAVLAVQLAAHETRTLVVHVAEGKAVPSNTYRLKFLFDGGADGRSIHSEDLHVNYIARRTIRVDGNLDDWADVLPQPMRAPTSPDQNLTEKAWRPFEKFDDKAGTGTAVIYMAYDNDFFYFAARIADETPYPGNIRFATRDDDVYFYPEKSFSPEGHELVWPAGVRRYSYRKRPDLPSGDNTDNVQLAFNAIPIEKDSWLQCPPGTPPKFMCYKCTDYEYAFNSVAGAYGGGAEIWKLLAPGVPRKHFFPRQPKAPIDGGPVLNGKLVMRREDNTRIVEAALPWSEIPDVQACMKSNQPVKITVRVNDNGAPGYELATGRSVSRINTYALHNYWMTHWANEVEFGFEK